MSSASFVRLEPLLLEPGRQAFGTFPLGFGVLTLSLGFMLFFIQPTGQFDLGQELPIARTINRQSPH